jgi:hypothetical protein
MRKRLLSFFLAFVATSFCFFADAQSDDPDGKPIPIEYNDPGESGDPIFRSGVVVPVVAFYFEESQQVGISFLFSVGTVNLRLTNLTTMSSSVYVVDSSLGNGYVPVTLGSGYYRLELLIADGSSFIGFFNVI